MTDQTKTREQKREKGLKILLEHNKYTDDDMIFAADVYEFDNNPEIRLFIPYPRTRTYEVYIREISDEEKVRELAEKYLGKPDRVEGIRGLDIPSGRGEIHMEFYRGNKTFKVDFYFEGEIK